MIFRCAVLIGMWCLLASSPSGAAELEYGTESDIAYYDAATLARADDYQKQQGKLDVYYPKDTKGFATVVWFHGGSLTSGSKYFPALKDQGIALVAASYRLAPNVQPPAYLEDSAAAVAWAVKNIGRYGGDPKKVFVAGHSAGAYLATMIAMDPKWLEVHKVSNRSLAGVIPVSGQMTTHFTVKKQRGDTGPDLRPVIDEYAPLYHTANAFSPICLIVGGRDIEFKSRVEENELMAVTLRNLGHKKVEFYEMAGLDHGTVEQGAMIIMRGFIQRTLQGNNKE